MHDQLSSYWLSGSIDPEREKSSSTYVERTVDGDLYKFLKGNGRLCSIIAARQMGKTSLIRKIRYQIYKDKLAISPWIDLQSTGKFASDWHKYRELPKKINGDICQEIKNQIQLDLDKEINDKFKIDDDRTWGDKFTTCLEIILKKVDRKIIIFIDELEQLDDELLESFLKVLRGIKENPNNSVWDRIVFVLVGCINPAILTLSPNFDFNICQSFELPSLSGDCQPLWGGISKVTEYPAKVIESILKWTGGHPFLTQYMCYLIEKYGGEIELDNGNNLEEQVENFIKNRAIYALKNEAHTSHFLIIQKRLDCQYNESNQDKILYSIKALKVYQKLLTSNDINSSLLFHPSFEENQLLISGIVRKIGDRIYIACQIYRHVFNLKWVDDTLQRINEIYRQKQGEIMSEKKQRDYVLIIDRSPSMESNLEPDGRTRWETIKELTCDYLAKNMADLDADGISVYFFSGKSYHFNEEITSERVRSLFDDLGTGGIGTNLAGVLKDALNNYFQRQSQGQIKNDGEWILIVTDGEPDSKPLVFAEIVEATKKISSRTELAITFLRVGNDRGAIDFLNEIDNELVSKHGAKLDICDTKSIYQMEDNDFKWLEYEAFND
jgi:Mg-chelatase subunit ChlD